MADDDPMSRVGEHAFLADLCHRLDRGTAYGAQEVPPGDDAAVIDFSGEHLVATTDSLVEDVHFRSGWLSPAELGKRAAVANLSDLSAMGATPKALLLALVLPAAMGDNEIEELTLGVAAAAEGEQARLVGGNLSRGASLVITITAWEISRDPPGSLRRQAGRPDRRHGQPRRRSSGGLCLGERQRALPAAPRELRQPARARTGRSGIGPSGRTRSHRCE